MGSKWVAHSTYRGYNIENRPGGKRVNWRYQRGANPDKQYYSVHSSLDATKRAIDTFVKHCPSQKRG